MKILKHLTLSLCLLAGTHSIGMPPRTGGTEEFNRLLIIAARDDIRESVELMLGAGADINTVDQYGNTPLMYAAGFGHEKVVRFLVQHGAKVNVVNEADGTPLMWAAEKGYTEIVRFLLPHVSPENLNQRDVLSCTALDLTQSAEIAAMLDEVGAEGFSWLLLPNLPS
jgi:ankyrin repeat protein